MQQTVHQQYSLKYSYKQYSLEEKMVDLAKSKEDMRARIYADYMENKNTITFTQFQETLRLMGCDESILPDVTILEAPSSRTRPCNVGYKVQLYDPVDLTKVVRVIDGMVDATIEIEGCSYSQMKAAARDKFIYMGYRWYLINKTDPNPFTPRDIGETSDHQRYRKGYTARLDDAGVVVEVFASQKHAADAMFVSKSMISMAVQKGKKAKGCFWNNWQDLSTDVQDTYLKHNVLPEPLTHHRATLIEKVNPITSVVVQTYNSFAEIQKHTRITPKVIKNASSTGRVVDGYKWRICDH
jgi:hypothetical protein